MANTKHVDIDLTIFETKQSFDYDLDECIKIMCEDKISKLCLPLQRLVYSLKYYQLLNITVNTENKSIFENFINEIYKHFLDDYGHLTTKHKQHSYQINQMLLNSQYFVDCNISKCSYTSRHHLSTTKKEENIDSESRIQFFKETMDSLHFYFFHLFHTGLRVRDG